MYRMDIGPNDRGPTFLNIVEESVLKKIMEEYVYTENKNGVITIESEDGIIFKFRPITPETIESINIFFVKVKKKDKNK